MSFATDLASLKAAINSFSDLIKNKFLTMIPASDKGALNGIAPLVNGLVPAQYLPSFVDDVLEFNGVVSFPAVGESGKLYVDISSSGGFNTSPFIASGSTVTAFPTGDANLSESLNNVTGQLQYGNTGSMPYKFALLFAMAAGQSIPVRVTVTNMVSTGPNWNYIGAGSLTTFQSASSSGLTNVTNGQQYTFTISDVNPYLIFRGDYPSDILRTVDVLIETQVSGSWVPLTSAVPGTGNCYRWTGSAYLQINNHVGNADVATKLSTARTISASGDASWSVTFDGSGNATAVMTLNTVPVSKGGTGGINPTQAQTNLGLLIGTNVQAYSGDLAAIAALGITGGFLKKVNTNQWVVDTNTYVTAAGTVAAAAQLTGVQQLNPLLGSQSSMAMSQDSGATRGSFIAKSTGTGDANLAGMTFWNDAYAIKMGVRADGYFGLGGWSRAAWSWYSDPSGNMVAAGNVSAYSDPRLKDNVVAIENALDICDALDGVFFTWNNRSKLVACPGKRDVGLLANQVKAILPMLVTPSITDDETGEIYDTVDYAKMVPVLLQAIKDLNAQIRQLKGN